MSPLRLAFLLELVALSGDAQLLQLVRKVYGDAVSLDRKLLVMSRVFASDAEYWSSRARALLEEYRGHSEEAEILHEFARWNVRGVEPGLVSDGLARTAESCESTLARAWLSQLTESHEYGYLLLRFLDCALTKDPSGSSLLPRVLTSVEASATRYDVQFETRIVPLLRHENDWVRVTAVRALGAVGGHEAERILRSMLDAEQGAAEASDRMVESAILALARLRGAELTPALVGWGRARERVFPVLRALERVGDERAIPYLEEKARAKGLWMAPTAQAALDVVRRRASQRQHGTASTAGR
jgi:hypothetical protein